MKHFLKKLWPFKTKGKSTDEHPVHLTFYLDDESAVWVDCAWKDELGAHLVFAELMHEVMNGKFMTQTLEFLNEECVKAGKEDQFYQIFEFLLEKEKLALASLEIEDDDEVVVKPTKVYDKTDLDP